MGYVGVAQLPQEPRLAHDELERLAVDVDALDHAGVGLRGALRGGGSDV